MCDASRPWARNGDGREQADLSRATDAVRTQIAGFDAGLVSSFRAADAVGLKRARQIRMHEGVQSAALRAPAKAKVEAAGLGDHLDRRTMVRYGDWWCSGGSKGHRTAKKW